MTNRIEEKIVFLTATLEAIHHAAIQATDTALEASQKMRETPGMEESSQKIKDAIRAVVSPMNSAIQTLIRKYPSTAKRAFHHSERGRAAVKEWVDSSSENFGRLKDSGDE